MTPAWRTLSWLAILLIAIGLLWLLSPVLLPFFLGMAIAYLLDPPVVRLEKWSRNRTMATLIIMMVFLVVVAGALALLLPVLERQLVGLVQKLIEASTDAYNWAMPYVQRELREARVPQSAAPNAGDIAGKAVGWASGAAAGLWSGGLAVVNVLSLLVITPIVTFYILRDWPNVMQRIDSWLPRDHAPLIRRLAHKVDLRLAGFVRGQALVCLLMGLYYAIALTVAGLNYGLLMGLLVGLLVFIPVLGAAIGAVISLSIAAVQFHAWLPLAIIAGIFLVGQFIEAYVLSPKLVGERIGIHPAWLLLALLAGGALFGFLGLLLAAPAAATIGVLAHFALERYLDSPLYRGRGKGTA
ncbi:MAG TPA: AI-2E family transporter [Alphaproteobacteria bacterium]|nr:AI-2E family transporter [Alphaproteobacteria bacterium]